jgi:hypothetical protein
MQLSVMYEKSAQIRGIFACHIKNAHYEIVETV